MQPCLQSVTLDYSIEHSTSTNDTSLRIEAFALKFDATDRRRWAACEAIHRRVRTTRAGSVIDVRLPDWRALLKGELMHFTTEPLSQPP